jgi:hypothetical protein
MSCQPARYANDFETKALLTKKQMREMNYHVRRIEDAKTLVCGVPPPEAVAKLRRDFEAWLPLLEEGSCLLNSGALLKERGQRTKMSSIYEGSLRIGLAAIEPFPRLLVEFKAYQEKFQSQLEGVSAFAERFIPRAAGEIGQRG